MSPWPPPSGAVIWPPSWPIKPARGGSSPCTRRRSSPRDQGRAAVDDRRALAGGGLASARQGSAVAQQVLPGERRGGRTRTERLQRLSGAGGRPQGGHGQGAMELGTKTTDHGFTQDMDGAPGGCRLPKQGGAHRTAWSRSSAQGASDGNLMGRPQEARGRFGAGCSARRAHSSSASTEPSNPNRRWRWRPVT